MLDSHIVDLGIRKFIFTAEVQRAQSKHIVLINKAGKRVIELPSVKRRGTVFLPFKTLAYFASLRLETSLNLFRIYDYSSSWFKVIQPSQQRP